MSAAFAIGLGLITLALQLIVAATRPLTSRPPCRRCSRRCPTRCCSTSSSARLLTVLCYSSLAIVLLTATLAAQGLLPVSVASGWCSAPTSAAACWRRLRPRRDRPQARRVPLGNLLFKLGGVALAIPLIGEARVLLQEQLARRRTRRWCCSTSSSTF